MGCHQPLCADNTNIMRLMESFTRLQHWLDATSIQQRLRLLALLSAAGLCMLLALSLLAGSIKDGYFEAPDALNAQQRQLQHFNTETARLQLTIQDNLHAPDDSLDERIDGSTEKLLSEFQALNRAARGNKEALDLLRKSLDDFSQGYLALRQINQRIDEHYHQELILPSQTAAALLEKLLRETSAAEPAHAEASARIHAAFIETLLKMNTYYTKHEMTVSHATRSALEHLTQTITALEGKALNETERRQLRDLQRQIQTMISGLGNLQRAYATRDQIMQDRIQAALQHIAQGASLLDGRYTAGEQALRARYALHQGLVNGVAVTLSLLVIAVAFGLGTLIFRSISTPLTQLLHTVEAYSAGDFQHPVPDVGNNELGQLAGSLREFRLSALQRNLAERALRDSEGRFRALSDMSSDFFWEQNSMLQYTAFSGQRAGELLTSNVLKLGVRPWENPRVVEYEDEWALHRQQVESHEAFRDFEFALQLESGTYLYLLASGDPVWSENGDFRGYRGTAKDVSAQKASEAKIREFNLTLEQRVIERTQALEHSNQQLSQAMEQLVQREKLASLGNLVAGVAHELNTPLGNALVAATSLHDQVREIEQRIDSGNLRKSDLTEFIQLSREGCELIERNAHRAVDLVANFKQVAVDQTSAQRRGFDLAQTVSEVVATLSPSLRKQQHTISIDIPPGIELDSYPGPLDQVITNLVTNATVHAFAPGDAGHILISASMVGVDEILLMISDNGVGIPVDKHARVFDPFFTTRMGQGGSGLGLYIVYNIVISLLGGSIQLLSSPGMGTCFVLRLPRIAPEVEEEDDA
ncbi:MAG: hypothetical protein BSR46_06750 [Candidatus Dactylopiibacterium carminicum]|nr:MAG: hypothetical protein BSR46_06750 [Candidatus Dactylopiibacterium carminicum]